MKTIQMKDCDCEEWKKYIPMINGYISMGLIHGMAEYSAKPFEYCPWCGKKRKMNRKVLKK